MVFYLLLLIKREVFYFDGSSGTPAELQKQLEGIKRREQDIDNIIDLEEYITNTSGQKPKVINLLINNND